MILKLGTTTVDGKSTYNVPEETRKLIASNLNSEGIDISTDDSIHFLQDISNLENSQKEKAVNLLNNLRGNPYDIKEEISKTKVNLAKIKKIIGDDIISPLSTAALFGMAAGSTLTETMPDLAPSVVTALSAGAITGNMGLGALSGGGQYLLSKFGNYIPIVGDAIEDVTKEIGAKETILATTGMAAIATLGFKILPKLVFKGVKGTYNKIKTMKEAKARKKDLKEQVTTTDIKKRIEKAQNEVTQEIETRTNNDILMDVIKDTLRSQGVQIPQEVKTKEELSVYVSKLSNEEKKEVYKISSILENIKENNNKSLKMTLTKVAKAAYWGGVIALAGLGTYDAFINPGFIEGLTSRKDLEKQLLEPTQESNETNQTITNIEITQESINEQAIIKLQNDLDTANQQIKEAIEEFRKMLPQEKDDYSSLMGECPPAWDFTKWFSTNQRNYENNKAIELLGINTEEGLDIFLHSINPNDENLKELMNQLGVTSIDELASSYQLQASLNLVGGGNWYFPDLTKYNGSLGPYGDFTATGSRKIGNTLIKIINSKYAENVSEIPLQSATDDEIVRYMQSLSSHRDKVNALSIYIGVHDKDANMLDYIAECIDDYDLGSNKATDLIEEINRLSNDGMNMSEVQEGANKVSKLIDQYQEAVDAINYVRKKSEGFMNGINSKMTNNPIEIAGAGATIGTGIGLVSESKNIFARMKRFIKSKISFRNKKKALPSGQEITISNEKIKNDKITEKRNEFNVKVAQGELNNKVERNLNKDRAKDEEPERE